ncbi:MAG: ferritin family protein [Candidatus Auribacterota bacterium]|jgi:rubrerythrin|nr:ferritin family protein [Candidatus Auribacterota bacterium]
MTRKFNIKEIFEIAIRIEQNGAYYYQRCAQTLDDSDVKDLLTLLAEMEVKHEHIFMELLNQSERDVHLAENFDPDDEAVKYVQALADGHVFDLSTDPASQLTGNETIENILKTALSREKESIVYYLGLKDFVPGELGKDKVDSIIREEMTHIVFISNALRQLNR